jgi:hypothetical protein
MGNLEGMAAVVSVWGNAAIQRLKPYWASLSSKVYHLIFYQNPIIYFCIFEINRIQKE